MEANAYCNRELNLWKLSENGLRYLCVCANMKDGCGMNSSGERPKMLAPMPFPMISVIQVESYFLRGIESFFR